jgi:tetratricopeptide (TPR) repeat protein
MGAESIGESAVSFPQVIPPSLRKKLQQCYEHGMRMMQQEEYDFDYAHSILVECVANDPGNALYLEAFLQNLQRKYHDNKRGSLLAFGGKGGFKKALARQDWPAVFKLGPEVLKSNPWDVATLRGLAEACAACGWSDVELRYLKNALDANPKDPEVNKHCAQSLARIGQFDQAIACWNRVDEARGGDAEAQRMISDLQIEKTRVRRGLARPEAGRSKPGPAPDPRSDAPAADDAAPPTEPPRREIKLTPRQRLEQIIANNPTDIDSYVELVQLHVDEQRLGDAAHVLQKALAASGNQIRIQELIEDIEVLRKKQQLSVAEKREKSENTDANRELAQQLRDDLNRMELEVFDRRAQRYPDNLELKFQLGLRLKRAGNFREAIASFQQSQAAAELRTGSAFEIGECLQRMKQYDKALLQYWVAADDTSPTRAELRKVVLYRIAILAEGLGNLGDAERSLVELTRLDPQYRDAALRLNRIRTGRAAGDR